MKTTLIRAACLALLLSACGGGGGGQAGPSAPQALTLSKLELAQTHVLSPQGKQWTLSSGSTMALHMTGNRAALALADVAPADADLSIEGRIGEQALGRVSLRSNADLPPTEDGGGRYSATARVAELPAAWMKPGLQLRVTAANAVPTAWQDVTVGAETTFAIRTIPFYLYGATETMLSRAEASTPAAKAMDEMRALWPISQLEVASHPVGRINWPELVVSPRGGNAAYVMRASEDRLAGFDPISAIYTATNLLRVANGEGELAVQYYGAMVQRNRDGSLGHPGGGLGGGHVGAGDHLYGGIFIHEQGHAFGMPHAGEAFAAGSFPYGGGSLKGSAWGYDQVRGRFSPTYLPTSSSQYARCQQRLATGARQADSQGRCVKQDPMQGGSGDQVNGDYYTLFADFNAARVQRYLEGVASRRTDGSIAYEGGRVMASSASATGYQRWNSLDRAWAPVDPKVDGNKGLYGVDGGFPMQKGVPVYTVFFTISRAGTPGATQVYPLVGPYTGNLLRQFDPTASADVADMRPNTGPYPWYCHASGCDYTLRVRYANGAVRHVAVRGAFRSWFKPSDAPAQSTTDPLNGDSFRAFAINVPADAAIAKVEVLDTPNAWSGLQGMPAVLAERTAR